jgi:uncharacterized protein with beta-barrel porin domain
MTLSGSTPFVLTGTPMARNALVAGVGLSYAIGTNVTASLAYDGLLTARAQTAAVKGEMRIRF